jgi:Amt family ammonium transporter
MGVLAAVIPWFTMNILHKRLKVLKKVDDTMAVFHTHAVAGALGGICVGLFAEPELTNMLSPFKGQRGLFYYWKGHGGLTAGAKQLGLQIAGALFIAAWNVVVTSLICLGIGRFIPLRMSPEDLLVGDDAAHGEEAYALWGDGETEDASKQWSEYPDTEIGSYEKSTAGNSSVTTPQGLSHELPDFGKRGRPAPTLINTTL